MALKNLSKGPDAKETCSWKKIFYLINLNFKSPTKCIIMSSLSAYKGSASSFDLSD